MKFQNPNMHSSEVIQCIKNCNGCTDGQTDACMHVRINDPEAICSSNFFEVGVLKNAGDIFSRGINI